MDNLKPVFEAAPQILTCKFCNLLDAINIRDVQILKFSSPCQSADFDQKPALVYICNRRKILDPMSVHIRTE